MRLIIFSFVILLSQALLSNCSAPGSSGSFVLPSEWTRDFMINLYNGGGMQDRSTSISITYDSSIYVDRNGTDKKITAFALTTADRAEILKKLRDLRVDQLRTVKDSTMTQDKESTNLCFQYKTEFCLQDGAATTINKDDEKNFSEAYRYLTDFAMRKK